MTRPRFSLRGLLLLTVGVALVCYWQDKPRRVANEFAALLEAGDTDAANSMTFVGEHRWSTSFHGSGYEVTPAGQSPNEWLRGRYAIVIKSKWPGQRRGKEPTHFAEASRLGIEITGANYGLAFGAPPGGR
jgi:hypothetical protein